LAPAGDSGGEFSAVKAEYESALRDFERHRFGARRARGAESSDLPEGPVSPDSPFPDATWPCLELLLKRGFPKRPRHAKEALRYEYARWRLEQALGPTRAELFSAFESWMLDLKAYGSTAVDPVLGLLRDLVEYRYLGLPAMRTHVVLSFGRLKPDPGVGRAAGAFLSELAAAVGIGGEIA
jgi:hypothetical protein